MTKKMSLTDKIIIATFMLLFVIAIIGQGSYIVGQVTSPCYNRNYAANLTHNKPGAYCTTSTFDSDICYCSWEEYNQSGIADAYIRTQEVAIKKKLS